MLDIHETAQKTRCKCALVRALSFILCIIDSVLRLGLGFSIKPVLNKVTPLSKVGFCVKVCNMRKITSCRLRLYTGLVFQIVKPRVKYLVRYFPGENLFRSRNSTDATLVYYQGQRNARYRHAWFVRRSVVVSYVWWVRKYGVKRLPRVSDRLSGSFANEPTGWRTKKFQWKWIIFYSSPSMPWWNTLGYH